MKLPCIESTQVSSRPLWFYIRGHSTTMWTKFYPTLTTYPPQVAQRYILHTTYFWFMGPNMEFLLTTYLPTSFWTRSYWMTPYDSILLWCRKTKLAKGNLFWLKKGSLRIDLTAELHFTMEPIFSEIAFEIQFFFDKKIDLCEPENQPRLEFWPIRKQDSDSFTFSWYFFQNYICCIYSIIR